MSKFGTSNVHLVVEKNKTNADRTTNGTIAKNQRTKSFLFNCSEPDASYRNDHSKNSPYEHEEEHVRLRKGQRECTD